MCSNDDSLVDVESMAAAMMRRVVGGSKLLDQTVVTGNRNAVKKSRGLEDVEGVDDRRAEDSSVQLASREAGPR